MSKKHRILIIENEKPIGKAIKLKLESVDFEVDLKEDGKTGIKAIESNGYDLVLLDLMVPEIDGFKILEELEKKKIKTPVIVLSNLGQVEDLQRAKSLGARDYLVKSVVSLPNVIKRIRRILK